MSFHSPGETKLMDRNNKHEKKHLFGTHVNLRFFFCLNCYTGSEKGLDVELQKDVLKAYI